MTNLSDVLSGRDLAGRFDIKQLLGERELARPFSVKDDYLGSRVYGNTVEATASASPLLEDESPFILTPPERQSPSIHRFVKEQEFEGTVVAVNEDEGTFTARLVDLTNNCPDEEGEFFLAELNGDEYLVVPGALFTWTIGLQWRNTTMQRVSDIRFRRLPGFTREAIAKSEAEAEELAKFLDEQDAPEAFAARPR
ncbi:hypothetical protein [Methylocaldum sp.]|uniref:hypothetical protein n=1 Tax=Methylocaldum sp. TaxID=1969727 RepID=UPI002D3B9587|nr:hypothetical protein [Methylocaldum sp.]HYE35377.1 hypothetical protein [Methylocaldum sp.]